MQTTPPGTTVAPTHSTAVSFAQAAEQVKAHLDIVQIIGRYVPTLKKRGRNHSGLCPFHNEKSPSFNVHAEKGLFKCFGCNEGGDALAFLMKIERKTYAELIEERAADMGLTIIRDHQQDARYAETLAERDQILALNEAACRWFESLILSGEDGASTQTYLTNRGYDLGWLKTYRVGLAANAWDRLTTYLLQQFDFAQADPTVLERAGLSAPRQKDGHPVEGGGYYDRFRHRLIIPILGAKNEVLGFGGRTLDPDGQPKYLNSPETALYVKSKVLYGLPQARPAIMAEKRAFLMEGYFDVLAAHKAGAMASVATCGTALTLDHVRQLVRLGVETVYCCFDNDTAGRQATLRAIDTVNQAILAGGTAPKVRVLNLPGGKDPDDYFKQATLADFEGQVTQAPDALSYQLDSQLAGLDLHSLEARLEGAARITPLLAKVPNAVVQSEYTRRYAGRLSIAPDALMAEVARATRQANEAQQHTGQGFQSSAEKHATFDLHGSFNKRDPQVSTSPSPDHWSPSPPLGKPTGHWNGGGGSGGKGRGFGKKAPPPRPDNFVELRRHLGTRHLLAEATLASLLFVSPVALESISPLLTSLTWQTPTLADLCAKWMALLANEPPEAKALPVGPALEPWLKHWVDRLMNEVADVPALRNALSACVFEAESITRLDGLDTLSPEAQRQRLSQRATTCVQAITLHQRQSRLKQMNLALEQIEKSSHNRTHWPDVSDDLAESAPVANASATATSFEDTQSAHLLELHYQLKSALTPTALVADEVAAMPVVSPAHSVLSAGPPRSVALHPASVPVSPVSVLPPEPAASKMPPDQSGWMEGPST